MYQIQPVLFDWKEWDELDSSNQLVEVLKALDAEELLEILASERKGKRDDYPIRGMWYGLVSGIVYQIPTIAELVREFKRNSDLRRLCGFESKEKSPSEDAYGRFLNKLVRHQKLVDGIFERANKELSQILPGFGKNVSGDSTDIPTYARGKADPKESADPQAGWGVQEKWKKKSDGSIEKVTKKWYGYTLQLLSDADYEIPVAYKLTKPDRRDNEECVELVEKLKKNSS